MYQIENYKDKVIAIFFTILSLGFVYALYLDDSSNNRIEKYANNNQAQEIIEQVSNIQKVNKIEADIVEESSISQRVQFTPEVNLESVQGAGSDIVDGCEDSSPEGCEFDGTNFQPVCSKGSVSTTAAGGNPVQQGADTVEVSKEARFEITLITAPTAILSGSFAPDDDRFIPTKEKANFKAAGDLVEFEDQAALYARPGEEYQELQEMYQGDIQRGNFSVHAQVSTSDEVADSSSQAGDKASVFGELTSNCPDVQSSNVSPDQTNKLGGYINKQISRPGDGQPTPRDYGSSSCIEIGPQEVDLPNARLFETCLNKSTPISELYNFSLSVEQWANCQSTGANCDETVELVGLMIDAPFGPNTNCNEGDCADQYFDNALSQELRPNEIRAITDDSVNADGEVIIQNHYVTTPCEVSVVDGIGFATRYDIPCLWDLSPYYNYFIQTQNATRPKAPDEVITFEEYWEMVEEEAERRGASCL